MWQKVMDTGVEGNDGGCNFRNQEQQLVTLAASIKQLQDIVGHEHHENNRP